MLVEVGMRILVKKELQLYINYRQIPFGINVDMDRFQGKIVTVTSVCNNYGHDSVLGDYERIEISEDGGAYKWNRFMLDGIVLDDNKIVKIG